MRNLVWLVVAAGCASSPSAKPTPPARATLAFSGVAIFDGEKLLPPGNVIVDGDRIVAVGDVPIPAGVETIDGRGKTLLPGLIDAHAHVSDAFALEQSLAFGVTTVLDMFSLPKVVAQLKAEDQPGRAELRSAGIAATAPGGHGTEYGVEIPTVTRPQEATAFVAARLQEGSDYIKIIYDDRTTRGGKAPTLSRDTMAALIAAAHAKGKLAVVHIGSYDEARAAIEAGADGLAHTFRDRAPPPGFGRSLAARGAFMVPTLAVLRNLYQGPGKLGDDPALAPYLVPDAKTRLAEAFPFRASGPTDVVHSTIGQLRDAGATVLAGTDAANPGTTYGASLHEELALLVDAGLPPPAALAAATSAPATAFRLADRGRIRDGLRADLVLVDGDPTRDILATRRIAGVWRGGKRFDRDAFKAKVAATPATPPPKPKLVLGLISDFNDGKLSTSFGHDWVGSTDEAAGGRSKVDLKVQDGTLVIRGQLAKSKAPAIWAGAMFFPGGDASEAVDMSAKKILHFRARGDGKVYTVFVFSKRHGPTPSFARFQPAPTYTEYELPWTTFDGQDGSDVTGVFFGDTEELGSFALTIDDVSLK